MIQVCVTFQQPHMALHSVFWLRDREHVSSVALQIKCRFPFLSVVQLDSFEAMEKCVKTPLNNELLLYYSESKDCQEQLIQTCEKYRYKLREITDLVSLENHLKELEPTAAFYEQCFVPSNERYVVIGDVHERFIELKAIVRSFDFEISPGFRLQPLNDLASRTCFVFVGDLIDKPSSNAPPGNLVDLLTFVDVNEDRIFLVKGNHEESVYKALFECQAVKENMKSFFSSFELFSINIQARNLFAKIYKKMKPFGIIKRSRPVVVTHSPCKSVYLTKLDSKSIKSQRYMYASRDPKEHEATLSLFNSWGSSMSGYLHAFGHIGFTNIFKSGSMVGLDTGASSSYRLSCMIVKPDDTLGFGQVSCGDSVEGMHRLINL